MHSNFILAACLTGFQISAAAYKLDHPDRRGKHVWVTGTETARAHPTGVHHWPPSWEPWNPHGHSEDHSKAEGHGHKVVHKIHKTPAPSYHSPKPQKSNTHNHPAPSHHSPKPQKSNTHNHLAPSYHSPRPQKSNTKHKSQHHKPSPTSTAKHHSSVGSGQSGQPTDYVQTVVQHHNIHRSNHSAPAIQWDSGLAATAAKIAKSCVYAHNTKADGGGYGQNIAAGIAAPDISHVISDMFYNSEVNWFHGLYGEAHPDMGNFEHWGHFSQIVWKSSTHVGCAITQYCPNGLANTGGHVHPYFTVCNYHGHGNIAGQYANNIGKPLGRPTVHGSE